MERRQRVELEFLEALRKRCPRYEPILEALGHIYTKVGRYEDGLKMDLELTRLHSDDPENWYNLGCSYALVQRQDDAFAALERAIQLGYSDLEWLQRDDDLKSIRTDPRFPNLIHQARSSSPRG